MEEEEDVYVSQLREVFDSCDLTGKGFLNRSELIDLCQRLQLDDQIPSLLTECIGDETSDGKVEFDKFKDAFVAVLSQTIDSMAEATEDDRSEISEIIETESEPYKVFNNKKYGRRSQQKSYASFDEHIHSDGDADILEKKATNENTPITHRPVSKRQSSRQLSRKLSKRNSGGLPAALKRKLSTPLQDRMAMSNEEILEGSGALNYALNSQELNEDLISSDEVEQLKDIWNELSVGVSGYLDIHELSIVCEHIGMENIAEQELELLFKELDANEDGLVSFDEFLSGLFLVTKQQNIPNDSTIESPIIPINNNNNVEMASTPQASHLQTPITSPRHTRRGSNLIEDTGFNKKLDILSFLDHKSSGWTSIDTAVDYLKSLGLTDLKGSLKQLQPNAEGEINLADLTKLLERLIDERGDGISQAVLQAYLHEINHLRGELESVTSERDQLKGNVSKFGVDSTILIRESEEQTRQVEQQYEKKLDLQDKMFSGKIQQKEMEWQLEQAQMQKTFNTEKSLLDNQLKTAKSEESKLKDKLMEAEAEIERLEQHVTEVAIELANEQKKTSRLEKDLESTGDLQNRLVELEASREILRDQYNSQGRTVAELELIKKELRDENDELQVELENLKAQLNTMGKKRHKRRHAHGGKADDDSVSDRSKSKSHRSKETSKVSKVGSYLSDYAKPVIIKRNDQGETTEEEDVEDDFVGVNEEDGDNDIQGSLEMRKKIREQELIIDRLRADVESTQKMLEGDVAEAKIKFERDVFEIEAKNLQTVTELQSQFDIERKDLIDEYESRFSNLQQSFADEKESMIQGFIREKEEMMIHSESDRDEARELHYTEKKKIENMFKQEREENDMNHRSKITKLEEQIVILETEKAEIELRFVNEKADMEQQFRSRFSELETRLEVTQNNLELAQKEISLLKEELSKRQKNNDYDIERNWRNKINAIETEKAELQMNFLNEKTEIEQTFRIQILELEQKLASTVRDYEQVQIDMKILREELSKKHEENIDALKDTWKTEKNTFDKERSELELNFMNKMAELEQQFRIKLSESEQRLASTNRDLDRSRKETEHLQDQLAKKHKDDINDLENKWKIEKQELIQEFNVDKNDIMKTHKKEVQDLQRSFSQRLAEAEKHYDKVVSTMKEEHMQEKTEIEAKLRREKDDLHDNLQQGFEHELTMKLSEARKIALQDKIETEKHMNNQNRQLNQEIKQERASFEKQIEDVKAEMQLQLIEEKAKLEEEHTIEKAELEEIYKAQIADLEHIFNEGESDLKRKLKEDFEVHKETQRNEFEKRYEQEKADLEESFAREKAELELSWQIEKAELEENFDTEKADLEDALLKEKEELNSKLMKQIEKLEKDHQDEIGRLKKKMDHEFNSKVGKETQLLERTVEHLENELNSLKEQKKELETKMQTLELKQLSQLQEAQEINEFKKEKLSMQKTIDQLKNNLNDVQNEKQKLETLKNELNQERTTILENSVREITDQHEEIFRLQSDNDKLITQISTLKSVENDVINLKSENLKLQKQTVDCQKEMSAFEKIKTEVKNYEETARHLESQNRRLETNIQEKDMQISRYETDLYHFQEKLENMENIHKKELEAQNERLRLSTTAATTEKSRYLREIQDIREQLNRATVASERDQALKAKVFNDAKAEVMNLNRKLEERARYIKDIENREKNWQLRMDETLQTKKDLEQQLKQAKEDLHENNGKFGQTKQMMEIKSTRSDKLVQELYIENADLTKQLQQLDMTCRKADKQVRQLTEQKKALQRVISKLCGANSIS